MTDNSGLFKGKFAKKWENWWENVRIKRNNPQHLLPTISAASCHAHAEQVRLSNSIPMKNIMCLVPHQYHNPSSSSTNNHNCWTHADQMPPIPPANSTAQSKGHNSREINTSIIDDSCVTWQLVSLLCPSICKLWLSDQTIYNNNY